MRILVTGAAASGKSAYAEERVRSLGEALIYVATMQVHGAEDERRVERHRKLRRGKGFMTLECQRMAELKIDDVPEEASVLFEDLGNIVANTLFSPDGATRDADAVYAEIMTGIDELASHCANFVAVGNEVGCGIAPHDEQMRVYIELLGRIACAYAATCDEVVECIAGIPQVIARRTSDGAMGA